MHSDAETDPDGELLKALQPWLDELNIGGSLFEALLAGIRPYLLPAGVEIAGLAVLYLFGRSSVGSVVGLVLLLIAILWIYTLQGIYLVETSRSIAGASQVLKSRLKVDLSRTRALRIHMAEEVRRNKIGVQSARDWISTEAERLSGFGDRFIGKVTIVYILTILFAAMFTHEETIHVFDATVSKTAVYIIAFGLFGLMLYGAKTFNDSYRLRLVAATLDRGLTPDIPGST